MSCMSKVLALTQLKRKFVESSLLPGPCHKKFTALTALLPLKRPCRHQPATFLLENVQGLTMRKKGQAKVGQPMPCFIHSHLSSCAVFVAWIPSFASASCDAPGSHHTGAGYSTWIGRLSGAAGVVKGTTGELPTLDPFTTLSGEKRGKHFFWGQDIPKLSIFHFHDWITLGP